ncbi:MAG: DNA polymerase III subunit delta' [Candidatus Omnitrophota bacterium]|nr:DNA polymerase III subunit delta' [Candidatus Omnitrophota bacterium]
MSFKDIIGQRLAVDLIKRAIDEKRFAHAYLFIGPEGVGKSLLAKTFAKALNCDRDGMGPCGECVSCKKIEERNHPDVRWFTYKIGEKRSGANDGWIRPDSLEPNKKSPQISIDMIRFLQRAMSLKPYEGRTKVYVIDGADNMTEEAANCLLKTLEEPPKDTVLILLASNMSRLMQTIISRCHKITFYPLDEESVKSELTRRYGLDEKKALCVSRFAEGSLGKAIETIEEDALTKRDKVVDEFISPKRLGYEDIWLYDEPRDKVNGILSTLAVYFRDLLVFSLSRDAGLLVNLDKADEVARDSKRYSAERLEEIIEAIAATQERIKRNANIKIALASMRLNIT